MRKKIRSNSGGILPQAFFVVCAVSAGYVAYQMLRRRSSSGVDDEVSVVKHVSTGVKSANPSNLEGLSVHREKHVSWIPVLRVREQKILSIMPLKKIITMHDLAKNFPSITVRTLRRDMDRLVAKGKVKKVGSTRSTTYMKV